MTDVSDLEGVHRLQEWHSNQLKRLEHGDQLLLHHALRNLCKKCGRILNWNVESDEFILAATCCGMRFLLKPLSVTVLIEEETQRQLLPPAKESLFPDPSASIITPNSETPQLNAGSLSKRQRALRRRKEH